MEVRRLSRREWLRLCGAAGASGMFVSARNSVEGLLPAAAAVDHLLLGVGDLDRGIAWVERRTGVKAVMGGSHPGVGTRNALLSLGVKRYLEIIAPDPAQKAYNFPIDVRKLAEPRLITWAAGTGDIDSVAKKARAAGYEIFGPREGSRARPDGKLLRWKTLGVLNELGGEGVEPIPFFIEWASGSLHPSQYSPEGCELQALEIEHLNPEGMTEALQKLEIAANVREGKHVRLTATLQAPKGGVKLS